MGSGPISSVAIAASSSMAITLLAPAVSGSLLRLVRGTITSCPLLTNAEGTCTPLGGHHIVCMTSPAGGHFVALPPSLAFPGRPQDSIQHGTMPCDIGSIIT
eukprot:GHVT01098763.1.p3 GENE.GHVT01098763.1~~GHVT01098763.1.p3  ORF type:complete len:102 (-),score=9.24 GHVT01098763.1:61-366(-)